MCACWGITKDSDHGDGGTVKGILL